ncbi:hypothetical protein ACJO2E_15825 [Marinobacter sp. M1N3S26]|uniref:hypothetical protein n=1 Tax=Marinobacter sp. M1N3S26 TaxID=3382299 RepID=UPI00387AC2ED
MNKSLSAAITTMLLVTSAAWATPESQGIRPMGDNQPDPSPTEQADQTRERHQGGPHRGEEMRNHGDEMRQQGDEMRERHGQGKDPHGEERWKERDDRGNGNPGSPGNGNRSDN